MVETQSNVSYRTMSPSTLLIGIVHCCGDQNIIILSYSLRTGLKTVSKYGGVVVRASD